MYKQMFQSNQNELRLNFLLNVKRVYFTLLKKGRGSQKIPSCFFICLDLNH